MTQLLPDNSLAFLLGDLARLFRHSFAHDVERMGLDLTAGEIRTLAFVARFPGSRQILLAERMGIEAMTLSVFVDRLEERGLLRREQDPKDRRAKNVYVTDAAEKVFETVRPLAQRVYVTASGAIPKADIETAERVLAQMRANLSAEAAMPMHPILQSA